MTIEEIKEEYTQRLKMDLTIWLKKTREDPGFSLRELVGVFKKVFTEEEIEIFIKELKL